MKTNMVDACIVIDMDDVDLAALHMRIDLIAQDAEGAVHAGTEGVSNGFNVQSEINSFSGIVFTHQDAVSFWCRHHGRTKASSTFRMPWDDALRKSMSLGEQGMIDFAETWRTVLDANRIESLSSHGTDPEIGSAVTKVHGLITALISIENPEFPTTGVITVILPTWVGGGSVSYDGKPILTSATEQAVLGLLPRIVEIRHEDETYEIRGMKTMFRFEAMAPLDILRTMSASGLDLSDRNLRKAGMRKG